MVHGHAAASGRGAEGGALPWLDVWQQALGRARLPRDLEGAPVEDRAEPHTRTRRRVRAHPRRRRVQRREGAREAARVRRGARGGDARGVERAREPVRAMGPARAGRTATGPRCHGQQPSRTRVPILLVRGGRGVRGAPSGGLGRTGRAEGGGCAQRERGGRAPRAAARGRVSGLPSEERRGRRARRLLADRAHRSAAMGCRAHSARARRSLDLAKLGEDLGARVQAVRQPPQRRA
mmetsp:Transcript_25385/g.65601  ORF Transcript_25385/g.65601 Transcript_25385/m.65601 type:complete len:236 (-) Transcript_25385:1626-2333(-)